MYILYIYIYLFFFEPSTSVRSLKSQALLESVGFSSDRVTPPHDHPHQTLLSTDPMSFFGDTVCLVESLAIPCFKTISRRSRGVNKSDVMGVFVDALFARIFFKPFTSHP